MIKSLRSSFRILIFRRDFSHSQNYQNWKTFCQMYLDVSINNIISIVLSMFSSLTFLEFAILTGFFLSYYCCPLQGSWRTNSWFIKHRVWRKASISVHKIVTTVGCVLLFFTNNQDSECLFYSFTFFKCSMFFWSSLWGMVN